MSKRIQLRRGTATDHNTFTGADGEVTVDTTNKTLRVHDGTTVGGTVLAKASQIPTAASTTNAGIIQLATPAEAFAGDDNTKAITPDTLLNGMLGHLNVTGAAGIYACRAWVNFSAVPLTGTYTQTGATVTVTMTNHGLKVGQKASLTFPDAGVSNTYTINTVSNSNTFTITPLSALPASGNTILNNFIRGSGNILGIVDNGVGDYTVHFSKPMPDNNYAVSYSASPVGGGQHAVRLLNLSIISVNVQQTQDSSNSYQSSDAEIVTVAIFR